MTQIVYVNTLVDITESGARRVRDSNTKEYHQQQNLNVLLQTIGLRSQIIDPVIRIKHNVLCDGIFGDCYKGLKATVWELCFMIDREDVWKDGEDELALLKGDINGVAITSDLDNTADFPVNIFDTSNNVNIVFEIS